MAVKSRHDVVIIGAGPAGSALGALLGSRGLDVLIAEKARFPRDKPCAGLLTQRCVRAVETIFGAEALARISCGSSTGARLFHGDKLVGSVDDGGVMHFTRRTESDAFFLAKARAAGCEVLEGAEARGIDARRGAVTLASGETVTGAVLVGADGASSVVRRRAWNRPARRPREMGFGLVAEPPTEVLKPGEIRDACARFPHIFFGAVPWGYGWIFPKGGRISIGVGGLITRKTDFRAGLRRLVERTCVTGTWERLELRGHPLPFGCFERKPGRANVLLVGDAAGLAEPVTGEGIAFALESALRAASAVAAALAAGAPADAGPLYNENYRRSLLLHFRRSALARLLLYPKPLLPLAMLALRRNENRIRWYFEIAAGDISYGEYFRRLARSILDFGF
jgi:geranylgeranyl reductase family protein